MFWRRSPEPEVESIHDGIDRFGRRCEYGSKFIVKLEDPKGQPICDPVPIRMALKRDPTGLRLVNTEDLEIHIPSDPSLVIAKICDGDTVLKEQEFVGPVDRICYSAEI